MWIGVFVDNGSVRELQKADRMSHCTTRQPSRDVIGEDLSPIAYRRSGDHGNCQSDQMPSRDGRYTM